MGRDEPAFKSILGWSLIAQTALSQRDTLNFLWKVICIICPSMSWGNSDPAKKSKCPKVIGPSPDPFHSRLFNTSCCSPPSHFPHHRHHNLLKICQNFTNSVSSPQRSCQNECGSQNILYFSLEVYGPQIHNICAENNMKTLILLLSDVKLSDVIEGTHK